MGVVMRDGRGWVKRPFVAELVLLLVCGEYGNEYEGVSERWVGLSAERACGCLMGTRVLGRSSIGQDVL
jgi:hypothetical protein